MTTPTRRKVLGTIGAAIAVASAPRFSLAQAKPLRLIVPYPAGSSSNDIIARLQRIAPVLAEHEPSRVVGVEVRQQNLIHQLAHARRIPLRECTVGVERGEQLLGRGINQLLGRRSRHTVRSPGEAG